jgi:hypothetical protein
MDLDTNPHRQSNRNSTSRFQKNLEVLYYLVYLLNSPLEFMTLLLKAISCVVKQ